MLGWRLLMSAILVPSVIGLFWLDHRIGDSAWVLLIFAVFVACRNSYELTDLMRVRCMKPSFPVTLLLSVGVVLAGWAHTWSPVDWIGPSGLLVSLGFLGGTLGIAFCLLLAWEAVCYQEPGQSMESLGCNLITVLYAGGLMALTSQLR